MGPFPLVCPLPCPSSLEQSWSPGLSASRQGPSSITSYRVFPQPRFWPLSVWFRGVRTFRISWPTPKIVVCEATLQEALRNHINAAVSLTLRSNQPFAAALGGSSDACSCYRSSEMQSPADRAGSDTRAGRFAHGEKKKGHDSRARIAAFPAPWRCQHGLRLKEMCA